MKDCTPRALSLVMAITLASSRGGVAYADEQTRPALDDERTARAEAQFRDAVEAFSSGRYYTAIDLFAEADRTQPKPELSFDIARSYESLGDEDTAASFYREYLRRAGHPADEAAVRARIEELESRRTAHGSPKESDDDGPHVLPAQTASGPFVREGQGRPANGSPVRDSESSGSGKVLTTMGWAGLGAAAVAFGGAAAFEVMRQNAEDDAAGERQQIRFDQHVQTMEADRTAARILFGTGMALAVTGGIFLLVGASQPQDHEKKSRVALRVGPEPGGFGAGASWRF